jgi:hypothetical protein
MNAAQNYLPRRVARLDFACKPLGGLVQDSMEDKLAYDGLIALQ